MRLDQRLTSLILLGWVGFASITWSQDWRRNDPGSRLLRDTRFSKKPGVSSGWAGPAAVARHGDAAGHERGARPASFDESSHDSEASDEDQPALAERLQKLEESFAEFQDGIKEDYAGSPGAPVFRINGRIHFDSWSILEDSEGIHFFENPDTGVDPENRVFFRRIRLEMGGDILENMLYRIQLDFNSPSQPEYKDVYLGFTDLPVVQTLLIGNQKRPLGLDHLNSSRFNVFIERPLVIDAFNEDARRIGIAAYGVSDDQVYHWRYGVYQLENTTLDGEYLGDSAQLSANARLSSSPWYDECSGGRGYFHWAIAGMLAHPDGDVDPDDSNENEARFRTRAELRSSERWLNTGRIAGAEWYEILGLESILNVGPLQIVGEYQSNWLQRDEDTPGTGPDLFFHGGYVYVAWMLTGEHVPYDRAEGTIDRIRPFENFFLVDRCSGGVGSGWGAWQVALRYSFLDLTDQDIRGGVQHDWTLGLVWYFNLFANLQINAEYGEIHDRQPIGGFADGHFTALGTRLRIEF